MQNVIILIAINIIPSLLLSMDQTTTVSNTFIKSLDGHIYCLPQDKVDISRFLVKKQWQKQSDSSSEPVHIPLDKQSFDLIFDAHESDGFDKFFHELSPIEKRLLTTIAGQKCLNVPLVTTKILDYHYEVRPIMKSHMKIEKIIAHLYKKMLQNQPHTKSKKKPRKKSFQSNAHIHCHSDARFSLIPTILIKGQQCNFNGHIDEEDKISAITQLEQKKYKIQLYKKSLQGKYTYYLTNGPTENNITPTLMTHLFLLTTNNYDHIISPKEITHIINTKEITHPNTIKNALFSRNGKYVATHSAASIEHPHDTLIVTPTKHTKPSHIIRMDQNTHITQMAFHPSLPVLFFAQVLDNKAKLILFDISSGKFLETEHISGEKIHIILFNQQGTRMLTATHVGNDDTYELWNTHNLKNISCITGATLRNRKITLYPQFDKKTHTLILPTNKRSLIFLNSITGCMIAESQQCKSPTNSVTHIVCIPNDTLCITSTSSLNKKKIDSTNVWNMKDGTLIKKILQNQTDIRGIGISPNMQYAVTTFKDQKMLKVPLISNYEMQCLKWLQIDSSLVHAYTLYHAYKAYKKNKLPSKDIVALVNLLPKTPCNIKALVYKYLITSKQK